MPNKQRRGIGVDFLEKFSKRGNQNKRRGGRSEFLGREGANVSKLSLKNQELKTKLVRPNVTGSKTFQFGNHIKLYIF